MVINKQLILEFYDVGDRYGKQYNLFVVELQDNVNVRFTFNCSEEEYYVLRVKDVIDCQTELF